VKTALSAGGRVDAQAISNRRALRRFQPITIALLDVVLVYAAFALAYLVRYELKIGPPIHQDIGFSAYQPIGLLLIAIMIPVLFVKDAYQPHMSTEVVDEFVTVFSAGTITVAAIVVIAAMLQQYEYSRAVVVYLWIFVILSVGSGRAFYRALQGVLHRRGIGVSRVLVVGDSDAGKMVMQSIMNRPDLGFHLAGFVYHQPKGKMRDFGRFRALGTVADVPKLIDGGTVDEIIIALPSSAHQEVWPILHLCERHGVDIKLIPDLFELSLGRVQVESVGGIPLLDVRERPLRSLARAVKRAVDVLFGGVALALSLPVLGVLALLIRLESKGPAFLRQDRVGLSGKRFTCYKLRTMRPDAEAMRDALDRMNETNGPIFKIRDDPRRTRLGRGIRRWSLDELPQFWNVLKGDMSIVGPRPPLPREVADYDDWHMRRLEVKPGMTGIWQVSGRSDLPFDEMVMMDVYYVDNWSLALDLKIMLRTILPVLARRGAY
jgi:exopolysaccharide biosynthesis polyprenyl glycosylphosphotransferase